MLGRIAEGGGVKRKRTMVEVCLREGKAPPCKHWAPDWVGFKCHGVNNVMQKCTGYEPKEESHE